MFLHYKEILGIIAIILWFIAYVPYFKDMFAGRTKPHVFSRFLRWLNALIIFFAQQRDHGGPGTWPTFFSWCISFLIAGYAIFHGGKKLITKIDIFFFIAAIIAVWLRIMTDTPLYSVILLALSDTLAYIPTFRKCRKEPFSETMNIYLISIVKLIVMLFALTHYTFITTLDASLWLFLDISFVIYLYIRRKKVLQD